MPHSVEPSVVEGQQETMIASSAATLLDIVRALVEEPQRATVEPVTTPRETVLVVTVGPRDLGKVIGKQGRTADSLRAVMHAIGTKRGHRFQLDIRSTDQHPKDRFPARPAATML
ncbi:hypothetical protein SAMN05421770_101468 [Granulicella rosea]|uniref:RNA-binding protein KhpA n=1 Tax=Granulicella rosea TaxID=474952 RepID=A0A239DH79_9BACT|nr:KH domain-containing protein [Granulicella rosea]SNS31697.1 hypothetical protein SAMN05421770_101468 [Granulicella rosea]